MRAPHSATATCAVCSRQFSYTLITKPRILCSLKCQRRRWQDFRNESRERQRARGDLVR